MARMSEERIICKGQWGSIEYAVKSNGSMPAKKFIDSLELKDKQNHARLNVLFIKFVKSGTLSKDKFKHLKGSIFEFKRHPYRVACFCIANRCLLTHVFDKKSSSAHVSNQIEKAIKIMNEHLGFER